MSVTSTERAELGYGLSEEEGEDFWLFGILTTIKISADDTDGQYCLIDAEVPPGMGSPWHRHRDEDEWFYVRDGEFTVYVGDDHLTLTAGGFAFGPKGVPHTFIAGPDGGKMLFGVGAEFEGLLREIAEPATEHVVPPPPRVRRTWRSSRPSRTDGRTTSSGPRVHPPGTSQST
jgi:quercetin dioxygenase-like cupin family protein